ncbi:MAG: hypothetical protein JOZ15_11315 [Acidobacteria bacterium]|nr:hypothetical protein [Acidobacteriota bacterium]
MSRTGRWLVGASLALVLAVAFYGVAARAVRGDVLNSYPFVTLDGFDWLLEGAGVAAVLSGNRHIDLPLLRNPLYVLAIAADAAGGGTGRLLLAIHAVAFFCQSLLLFGICEVLGTERRLQLAMPALLGLSALGGFRFAIFPDDLALVFLLASLAAILLWRRGGRRAWLIAAGLAAVCGALTQEYAAMPLAMAAFFYSWLAWRRRGSFPFGLLVTCAASGLAYLALDRAWSAVVPYRYDRNVWAPFTTTIIRPALVLKFDLLLWLHVFWPLTAVLAAAAVLVRRGTRLRREASALLAATIAAFMALILAYRWPDARYTYILIPLVLLFCAAAWTREALSAHGSPIVPSPPSPASAPSSRLPPWPRPRWLRWLVSPLLAAAVWCAQGTGLFPPLGRWMVQGVQPLHRADGSRVDSWPNVREVAGFQPVDRFRLAAACGSSAVFCPAAVQPPPDNDYDRVILCEYRALKLQDVIGTCGNFAPGMPANFVPRRAASGAPACIADATHLCVQSGRFRISVTWRAGAQSGVAGAIPIAANAGGFWFFSPETLDLTVKVVDGRPINGRIWFFYAALSDAAYSITVTDTRTGRVRSYANPAGKLASVADTGAF